MIYPRDQECQNVQSPPNNTIGSSSSCFPLRPAVDGCPAGSRVLELSCVPRPPWPLAAGEKHDQHKLALQSPAPNERHVQSFHQNVYDLAQLLKTNVSQSNWMLFPPPPSSTLYPLPYRVFSFPAQDYLDCKVASNIWPTENIRLVLKAFIHCSFSCQHVVSWGHSRPSVRGFHQPRPAFLILFVLTDTTKNMHAYLANAISCCSR